MADKFETRMVSAEVEFRDEGDAPTIVGHAATFNQPYHVGYFTERIHPDAFRRTLSGNPDVRLLVDHEGQPLARTKSGTLTLGTDETGLTVRAVLDPSDPDVQRLVPKMRRGDLDQMSFAFRVPADGDEWDYSGATPDRTIREANLSGGDVSIVTYPANENASVALRSREARDAHYTLALALLAELRNGRTVDPELLTKTMDALGVPDMRLSQSFNDTERALRDALQAQFGGDDGDECCDLWVQDASTDWVVFTAYGDAGPGRGTWQMSYTTSDDGSISLTGDPVQVTAHTTYTPVESQQNSLPLDLAQRLARAADLRRLSA